MLQNDFERIMADGKLLPRDSRNIVIGYSGGLDSSVLLHLFASFVRGRANPVKLTAAHLNHALRGCESDADEMFCREQADNLGIEIRTARIDVVRNRLPRETLESAARRLRYKFLYSLLAETGGGVLALAHHADDHAETILMNIARGSGVLGLCGIPRVRLYPFRTIRPLLDFPKATLAEFANHYGLPFREDSTNRDPGYRRNLVRIYLLPALGKSAPDIRENLIRLGRVSKRYWEWMRLAVADQMPQVMETCGSGELALNASRLRSMHPQLRSELLRAAVKGMPPGERGPACLGRVAVERINSLLEDGRPGQMATLGKGMAALLSYRVLLIRRVLHPERRDPGVVLRIESPDERKIAHNGVVMTCSILERAPVSQRTEDDGISECFDLDRIRFPLRVRNAARGERFTPLGAPGSKRISAWLRDHKVPREMRASSLVVEDADGEVLWLWPHRLAQKAALNDSTRNVLRIRISRE